MGGVVVREKTWDAGFGDDSVLIYGCAAHSKVVTFGQRNTGIIMPLKGIKYEFRHE